MANEPEEKRQPGYFTENVYGVSPVILGSANAEILAFAARYRARFGNAPVWQSVAGYDSGHLSADVVHALASGTNATTDPHAIHAAVLNYLVTLNSPAQALTGVLDHSGSMPTMGDAKPFAMAASAAATLNRRRCNSSPSLRLTIRRLRPAFETSPGVTRGSSGSFAPVSSSTSSRVSTSARRASGPTFTFGCAGPATPGLLPPTQPTSASPT